MKIQQLLENYAEMSLEEWNTSEVLEQVKNDCSKFINEFLKNGMPIYRGLDAAYFEDLHLISTLPYRDIHGMSFDNRDVRESFERFLESMGVSRYKHSVSTIGFDPDMYDGIDVEGWFFFLAKGGYSYHYYSGIAGSGDINIDNEAFEELSSLGTRVEIMVNEFEMLEYQLRDTTLNLSEIFIPHDLSLVEKMLNEMKQAVNTLKDIFNLSDNDMNFLKSHIKKMDVFLRHTNFENDDNNVLEGIHDSLSAMNKIIERLGTIETIKRSVVVNELPNEKTEMVFTCKEYYAIPYNEDGEQFIKELIK